jgi:hypothetical protein
MERKNSVISLRKSQALAMVTAFKRSVVEALSRKYAETVEKYKLGSDFIYNPKEGGLSTVHNPSKLLLSKRVNRWDV